ncbi:MAG TPA: tripartite tricarboxylate transporter substrate binding protein [Casimicrobium sp.]|nr:tripartite tricarboxylate transporter substrate binding protein [Casimicrobium sp.]
MKHFIRKALAVSAVALCAATAFAQYPNRPITLIVPWGAGGGTDYHARTIASMLEKELKQPVTVVNRTGGSGVVGHSAIAEAAPDGYTIGTVTVEINMMHWMGLTKLTQADYAPVGLLNFVPAGVEVAADSKYKTLKDVLDDAKANPGKLKASGTGQGGIWHLALAGMLMKAGMKADQIGWIPSDGAASGLKELVAGSIQVSTVAPAEASTLIKSGKVRLLAAMTPQRIPAFPDAPTLKEQGLDWELQSFISLMGPKGMPKEAVATLEAAMKKIQASPEWKAAMDARGFGLNSMSAADLGKFAAKSNQDLGTVMKAIGIAK